jgi:Lipoxygenase
MTANRIDPCHPVADQLVSLPILQGIGDPKKDAERAGADRIYDYDYYNDLGKPNLLRPVLGAEIEVNGLKVGLSVWPAICWSLHPAICRSICLSVRPPACPP